MSVEKYGTIFIYKTTFIRIFFKEILMIKVMVSLHNFKVVKSWTAFEVNFFVTKWTRLQYKNACLNCSYQWCHTHAQFQIFKFSTSSWDYFLFGIFTHKSSWFISPATIRNLYIYFESFSLILSSQSTKSKSKCRQMNGDNWVNSCISAL